MDLNILKQQIVTALKPLDPEKIILFGSYAYGNPSPDSDLDICVVEKKYDSKWKEKEKIRNLLKEINSVFNDIDLKGDILWQKSF